MNRRIFLASLGTTLAAKTSNVPEPIRIAARKKAAENRK